MCDSDIARELLPEQTTPEPMMKTPIPCPRLIAVMMAVLLIAACEDASESSATPSTKTLAVDPEGMRQRQERSEQALGISQQQLAALRREQAGDRRRIADLSAHAVALEGQNRELGQRLAQTREQLAQSGRVQQLLRQQRDLNARRAQEISSEQQSMRARLASAQGEIQRLQAQGAPNQRQMTDLYHRAAAADREAGELRRYNAFLLQERSNLQVWLQEANTTRSAQQNALRLSGEEAERIKGEASTSTQKLREALDKANESVARLTRSRDTLTEEARSLRADLAQARESESRQSGQLHKALAHAAALADANKRIATELQSSHEPADQPQGSQDNPASDVKALRAEIERSTSKIAKLQAANDYLVDKIEACALQQRSSWTESSQKTGAKLRMQSRPRLIAVAEQSNEDPKSTRREKELNEAKDIAKKLQQQQESLNKRLADLEAENASVKKQVETLTWANKELVKELNAAYATRDSTSAGSQMASADMLPNGARGIYVLRKGESLSRVANAFYGDPNRWHDIVEANKDKIPDPDMVKAGTVIVIPE